jgi:exopolyphosphatase / guanosine-5'-triphosphate,3'-diphosphate pyrophosphatase
VRNKLAWLGRDQDANPGKLSFMFRFGQKSQSLRPTSGFREALDRGRFDELEPIAVVDIGSNSVRLVVYEGAVRAPTPLFNEKVLCGLGRTISDDGMLHDDSMERALNALRRFRALIRTLRAKNVQAIATAAVRDATNGTEFIAQAEAAIGIHIDIIPGEREAELAAQGIYMGFVDPDGIVGDLGGGSLELVNIADHGSENAVTLPLGGFRLMHAADKNSDAAEKAVEASLKSVGWLGKGRDRTFYAVGGTWRALAKLHMAHTRYPLRVMHQYEVDARQMIAFCREIRKPKKSSSIGGYETVSKARRELLPDGAMTLERLLVRTKAARVVFSVFGIREGLVYGYLPEIVRASDPLLAFCEDYARLRSRSARHAHELVAWTEPLFQSKELQEDAETLRLRTAACLLSDIGWRAHPDYRGEQSLNVIAHAALAGIDHPGRLFLALSVYFRHAGPSELEGEGLSAKLRSLAGENYTFRARVIAAAVRVAHMLSAGMAGVIDETRLSFEPGKLVLELPPAHAALDGERLNKRFKTLGDLLGRESVVRITE